MLDSESRYLPVLSAPSSRASSPAVSHNDAGQRRLTGDVTKARSAAADGVLRPTKSTSDPTPRSRAVGRHAQCSTARTLHLESTDMAVDTSVMDPVHSHDAELHVERKSTQRPSNEDSDAVSSELHAAGKYGGAEYQLHDERSRPRGLLSESSDAGSFNDGRSDVAEDKTLLQSAVDVVSGHRLDTQQRGRVMLGCQCFVVGLRAGI